MRAVRAFLIRDALMETSYRLDFGFRILSIVLTITVFSFIAKLVGENAAFDEYGGYFPFAAVGLALMSYFQTGFKGFATAIRNEQMMGTLEALLMTPARVSTIVIASSTWSFFWATVTAAIYLVTASLLYDIELQGNLLLAGVILLLTIMIFSSMGVISASFVMVFKRGDPVGFFFGALSMLLGGVFIPVDKLEPWMQKISFILPITYGAEGLRSILLKGESLSAILPQITVLLVFVCISVPVSLFCFKKAVLRAQREGTLVQY